MKPNQKYAEWIAELRGIARNCRYVCSNDNCKKPFVDELIRDIVVLNTPHETVRTATLQKIDPSLENVMAIAESFEATQSVKKRISTDKYENEVFQLKPQINKRNKNFSVFNNNNNLSANNNSIELQSCSGCGTHHPRQKCKFRNAQCRICQRFGHIAPVCKTSAAYSPKLKRGKSSKPFNAEPRNGILSLNLINSLSGNKLSKIGRKYMIEICVNSVPVSFQLDSGATCSVIGFSTYQNIGSPALSSDSNSNLISYGGSQINILGTIKATLKQWSKEAECQLIVTDVAKNSDILDTDLLDIFDLCICQAQIINTISLESVDIDNLVKKFSAVFSDKLGHCNTYKADLKLKPNATPRYFKARPIPFAQMDTFQRETQRLIDRGIWKQVNFTNWAAPIVVVPKKDGRLRICGDFKAVNAQLDVDQYPIPRFEEMCIKLRGGKFFSKIDLSDAYLQIELTEESKGFMVVNTPLGLFQYQRLPFGVASAPAIFQRLLEQVTTGIPLCINYLDDILVAGTSETELMTNLTAVLTKLQENGFTCQKSKCAFMQRKVEYLGFSLDSNGCKPTATKIEAIRDIPRPTNLQELQVFLGKINYYNKLIPNFAHNAAPLNKLKRQDEQFRWGKKQEDAFQALKHHLSNTPLLVHFDDNLPIILATDASSYGIGAVISHRQPDGSEKPIAYASKTLDETQRRYSQIEKEALSIIFGVKKFHQYLFGRHFTLLTDHKPLVSIFSPDKQLPVITIQQLQRWALTLMAYRYTIQYRPTQQHSNADALSRLPKGPDVEFDRNEACLQIDMQQQIMDSPLNVQQLKELTMKDAILRRVRTIIEDGWPEKLLSTDNDLQSYFNHRHALSLEMGVIILQTSYTRVVIPERARSTVLQMLHDGHWGMTRMKQMARRYCWWPSMDTHIEKQVSKCEICQQQSTASPARKFLSWPAAERPWQRIHLDFAGPFYNATWLICVDTFSKYPFVTKMSNITAHATIDVLNVIFSIEARHIRIR